MKLTSDSSIQNDDRVLEYDFSIALFDSCINDELSSPSTIDDFAYYIAATGMYPI